MPRLYSTSLIAIVTLTIVWLLISEYIDVKKLGSKALAWIKNLVLVLMTPKILLTFGIAWMITNGWSYLFVIFGSSFKVNWMLTIGLSYQAFLWLPITPEKIVTVAISIWLAKVLFPKDLVLRERLRELNPKNLVK